MLEDRKQKVKERKHEIQVNSESRRDDRKKKFQENKCEENLWQLRSALVMNNGSCMELLNHYIVHLKLIDTVYVNYTVIII